LQISLLFASHLVPGLSDCSEDAAAKLRFNLAALRTLSVKKLHTLPHQIGALLVCGLALRLFCTQGIKKRLELRLLFLLENTYILLAAFDHLLVDHLALFPFSMLLRQRCCDLLDLL